MNCLSALQFVHVTDFQVNLTNTKQGREFINKVKSQKKSRDIQLGIQRSTRRQGREGKREISTMAGDPRAHEYMAAGLNEINVGEKRKKKTKM